MPHIHAVCPAPLEKGPDAASLLFAAGDNDLATLVQGQSPLPAVLGEPAIALPGKSGFEAVCRVVESRVQNPAVSAARVEAESGFLFHQGDGAVRIAVLELQRQGHPHHATADEEKIRAPHIACHVHVPLFL